MINCGDFLVSNYVQDFLHDYFKMSDLSNYFLKIDINPIVKEKDPTEVVKFDNKKLESLTRKKEENRIFYFKSKKYRHYCKLI